MRQAVSKKHPAPRGRVFFLNIQTRGGKNKSGQTGLFSEALSCKAHDWLDNSRLLIATAMPKGQFLSVLPFSVTFVETWASANCVLQLADPNSPSQTCLGKQRWDDLHHFSTCLLWRQGMWKRLCLEMAGGEGAASAPQAPPGPPQQSSAALLCLPRGTGTTQGHSRQPWAQTDLSTF